jgi:hypothetical protein
MIGMLIAFILGFAVGFFVLLIIRNKSQKELTQSFLKEVEAAKYAGHAQAWQDGWDAANSG